MKKKIKYETPELEITRFDVNKTVMTGPEGDGDIITDSGDESKPDGGPGDLWDDNLFN